MERTFLGGRIALINSVLYSLPVYMFSFYKAPKKNLKTIVAIQRKFLWGGDEELKICWVSWSKICLPKKERGLGIKNVELFNESTS